MRVRAIRPYLSRILCFIVAMEQIDVSFDNCFSVLGFSRGVIKFVYAVDRSAPKWQTLAPSVRIQFRLARQLHALPGSELTLMLAFTVRLRIPL